VGGEGQDQSDTTTGEEGGGKGSKIRGRHHTGGERSLPRRGWGKRSPGGGGGKKRGEPLRGGEKGRPPVLTEGGVVQEGERQPDEIQGEGSRPLRGKKKKKKSNNRVDMSEAH